MKKLNVGIISLLLYFSGTAFAEAPSDIPRLIEQMMDLNAKREARFHAAETAASLLDDPSHRKPEFLPLILKAAKTGNSETKTYALRLLTKYEDPQAEEQIQQLLLDSNADWETRGRIVSEFALSQQTKGQTEHAKIVLRKLLEDQSSFVRVRAAAGLILLGDTSATDLLIELARNKASGNMDKIARREAIRVLGETKSLTAMTVLDKLTQDPDAFVRVEAIQAINELKYASAGSLAGKMEMLKTEFDSKSWGPHDQWAFLHLVNILNNQEPGDSSQAFSILKSAANDPDHRMTEQAKLALKAQCEKNPARCLSRSLSKSRQLLEVDGEFVRKSHS